MESFDSARYVLIIIVRDTGDPLNFLSSCQKIKNASCVMEQETSFAFVNFG
jgi:hypothetical protein